IAPRPRALRGRRNRHIVYLSCRAFGTPESGFLGSFRPFGIYRGILSGSAIGAAMSITLDRAAVDAWGWRIPFLLRLGVGITGLAFRRYLIEDGAVRDVVVSPVTEAFRTAWRTIAEIVGLNVVSAVNFYFCFLYVTTYLRQTDPPQRLTSTRFRSSR